MKRKIAVAAALAATLLGAAACGNKKSDDSTSANAAVDGKGKTIKVWLMVDAQSGPMGASFHRSPSSRSGSKGSA